MEINENKRWKRKQLTDIDINQKNNKFMLILLLGQALIMGLLINLATEKNCMQNPVTASMVYVAFTMAASWLGLFNTIQEIVKEKDMLKKEYIYPASYIFYTSNQYLLLLFH